MGRPVAASATRGPVLAYVLAVGTGAFLLFQVQPLIARFVLPWFGGAPSVWTLCMLFFQSLLLAGYAWSHLLARRLTPGGQAKAQVALLLLSLLLLPIVPSPDVRPAPEAAPEAAILLLLLSVVGLPYFVLATTAPLVQSWFARRHSTRSPYGLYAVSNACSLAALLTYPVLVEPLLPLRTQAHLWSALYLAFVLAYGTCAVLAARTSGRSAEDAAKAVTEDDGRPPGPWDRALWFLLPFAASVLLLAVTNEFTHNIAVIPFLWILPLTLYLLSFVLCFSRIRFYRRRLFLALSLLGVAGLFVANLIQRPPPLAVDLSLWSLTLFAFCMAAHGETVRVRPPARHLTAFYLLLAAGGATGGLFVGIVAPLVFTSFVELWLALFGGLFGLGLVVLRDHRAVKGRLSLLPRKALPVGAAAALVITVLALAQAHAPPDTVITRVRNFYGTLQVEEIGAPPDPGAIRKLANGRVVHGAQFLSPGRRRETVTYYADDTGLSLAIRHHPKQHDRRFGGIGLGAGTLAAFTGKGDHVRFYEINPLVTDLARRHFTFLSDTEATVTVLHGDGRLLLDAEEARGFDLLVVDAFTGEAPPTHLFTREAFAIYFRHLAPDGVLALHISSRHFDLAPVIRDAADHHGYETVLVETEADDAKEIYAARWMLVTRNAGLLESEEIRAAATGGDDRRELWTDDFQGLVRLLR